MASWTASFMVRNKQFLKHITFGNYKLPAFVKHMEKYLSFQYQENFHKLILYFILLQFALVVMAIMQMSFVAA